ncbi:hypothetical protein C3L50_14125 [Flavobacterium alvei]|uniref:Bacterial HORMA domain-containing protein n=1 Tax=Flavobacterium alvei TaxID=2080416 RepID=A0A2S5A6G7_9FLAO|nr:hypothetical protein [Flavobacterium alvei]POY37703.1 hypothetical protein C3L50_14125 [Flavobacterium alvei]
MYNTITNTTTYTVIDIRKTFEGCETDIRTIARRTGKWEVSYTDNVFNDIMIYAENEYLKSVDIVLLNENNTVLRASKFVVNANGTAISSERAGNNNDWSNLPDTHLSVILSFSKKWNDLTATDKSNFQKNNNFKLSWSTTDIDNSFPHLSNSQGQLYGSKGYELQKTTYK